VCVVVVVVVVVFFFPLGFSYLGLQDGSLDFGRRWREAAAVALLTQSDLLAFFDEHLGLASPTRRKLSLQVCTYPILLFPSLARMHARTHSFF
jgi:hypothetical protein